MCRRSLPCGGLSVSHPVLWQGRLFSNCSSSSLKCKSVCKRPHCYAGLCILSCFCSFSKHFPTTALRLPGTASSGADGLCSGRCPTTAGVPCCCRFRPAARRPQTKAHPSQVHRRALLLTAAGKQCVHKQALTIQQHLMRHKHCSMSAATQARTTCCQVRLGAGVR